MTSKVFILGLDGGSLQLIERWQDELPNFREIMRRGAYGEILSSIPPVTCPAWPCMFTGKNPGKLNIYGFMSDPLNERENIRIHNSSDYSSQSLWRILSDYGKKVILLNIPLTYPPPKVNGLVISGMGTPFTDAVKGMHTYPRDFADILDQIVGGYVVEPAIKLTVTGKENQYQHELEQTLIKRVKATKYLISKYDWDLFICVFSVLDRVQHYFWHYMNDGQSKHTSNKYQTVIKEFYKKVDQAIGELFRILPPETNILITSDHGFQGSSTIFSINSWLANKGLLVYHKKTSTFTSIFSRLILLFLKVSNPTVTRLIGKLMPHLLSSWIYEKSQERARSEDMLKSIDLSRTRAFAFTPGNNIFINVKGRNTHGVVGSWNEYEEIRQDIIDSLSKLKDPQTGEPVTMQAFKKEEIYQGKYVPSAPDIVVIDDKYTIRSTRAKGDVELQAHQIAPVGKHCIKGVFMACGPDINNSKNKLTDLKILDITPTVLHMLRLPVPTDMDGRVITEVFKEGSGIRRRKIAYNQVDDETERIMHKIKRLKLLGQI